jgi:4-amino-4-deoxy-L-arabinose transferase-like glycosyltransferase
VLTAATLGLLGATTPLMSHVAGRFWLDGPLLAFATLAVALHVGGAIERRRWMVIAAGLALGYASLIKATAVLVVLPAVVLAQALAPQRFAKVVRDAGCLVGLALVVHLPWLVWQWSVLGTPFPEWAGRPPASLVNANPYVHYLTVVRSAWTYVELLPQIMWTVGPAFLLWWSGRRFGDTFRVGGALLAWVVLVVGAHMVLGAMGYSKVMRYVILMVPGGVLLISLGVSRAVERARAAGRRTIGVWVLLLLAAAGLGLEVAQGLRTSLHDNARMDLVRPLFGVRGVDY